MYFYVERAKKHILTGCMLALIGRSMLIEPSIAMALIIISLVVSICYTEHYLVKQKADLTEDQSKLIKDMEAKVNHLTLGQSFKRGVNDFIKK